MFIPAGSYQGLMDLNAELWVLAKYRKGAWINAYHAIEKVSK